MDIAQTQIVRIKSEVSLLILKYLGIIAEKMMDLAIDTSRGVILINLLSELVLLNLLNELSGVFVSRSRLIPSHGGCLYCD